MILIRRFLFVALIAAMSAGGGLLTATPAQASTPSGPVTAADLQALMQQGINDLTAENVTLLAIFNNTSLPLSQRFAALAQRNQNLISISQYEGIEVNAPFFPSATVNFLYAAFLPQISPHV